MLKKRIIGVVVVKDQIAVQSIGFKKYLPIGKPEIAVEFLNQWGIDEIVVLDIDATKRKTLDYGLMQRVSKVCRVPLAYGGGIKSASEMTAMVQAGADKVVINTSFFENPKLIAEGAELLGNQCIVVSLDFVKTQSGYQVFRHPGETNLNSLIEIAQKYGAGEFFINSVDRDGSKKGFDLELATSFAKKSDIPVILCGGAGEPEHFASALKVDGIAAVAAANFFSFTEHSVTTLKGYLSRSSKEIRNDSYFHYTDAEFLNNGRIARKDEKVLQEMLFERHAKEII